MATPAALFARITFTRLRCKFDCLNPLAVEEVLVGFFLYFSERAEDDSIRFLRQLMRDENLHPSKEELWK